MGIEMSEDKVLLPSPKLLSSFNASGHQVFSGASLAKQPEIALCVSMTIAHMAAVDAEYEHIIIKLMGDEGYSVSTMLRSIRSTHERHKLTLKLIEIKLDKDHRELFNTVNNLIKPVRDIRNQFAHGLWGYCSSIEDGLLLSETKPWGDMLGAAMQLMKKSSPLNNAKNFIFKLLEHKDKLGTAEQKEASAILFELNESIRGESAWSLFFPEETERSQNDPQVWTVNDALLAAKAAEAAVNTIAACSSCVGPMAQEVAPVLAKVQSEGLLRQALHISHPHNGL